MTRTDEIRAYVTNEARFFKRVDLSREDALYLIERCDKLEACLKECSGELDAHYHPMKVAAEALLAEDEPQHPPGLDPGGGHRNFKVEE